MLELIQPMGSVLLSWLAFFLLFSGLGLPALRAFGRRPHSGWLWIDSFWLGWALSIGFMQLWHFILPVNDALLLLLALFAALALATHWRHVGETVKRLARDRRFVALFALLALWMSNRALGMPIAFDTGFRDIQAVMWLDAYPIVPGLGNLFSSLAFNHSVYLYDALLDASIWSGRSIYIATGLLLVVYTARALAAALQLWRSEAAADLRWSTIFATLTLPYVVFQTVRWGGITHFLTDTVVDLIGFMTLIYLLDFLQGWQPRRERRNFLIYRLALIILIGMTVKQSYVVYGVATAALALVVWARRGGLAEDPRRIARLVLPISGLALALILPWMARGVVTSGYIAYPHSLGRFEVDWAMPPEEIEGRQQQLATNTRSRGGDPALVLASWDWLGPWLGEFANNVFPTLLPSIIAVVALAAYAGVKAKKPAARQSPVLRWWALSPMLVMLVFWFFTVPEDKYVRYIFWSLAALSVTLLALELTWIAWRRRVTLVFALVALALAYVAFSIVRHEEFLLPAGPEDGFHAHFLPIYQPFTTDDGTVLNRTIGINQCWHIPLPCTPRPEPGIHSRAKGELRHGFRFVDNEGASAAHD